MRRPNETLPLSVGPVSKHLTPPVSPTPFMLAFAAAKPPSTSTVAYPAKVSMKERWNTMINNASRPAPISTTHKHRGVRKWLLIAALPTALLLLVAAATSIAWRTTVSRKGLVLPDAGIGRRGFDEADLFERASPDEADEPILSVGGITNAGTSPTTSPTPTTSLTFVVSGSNSGTDSDSTPTTTVTVAPSVPSNPVLPTPFVQPFDATLSTDFLSGSCQTFFTNLTQSLTFRQCRPFSLLLATSQGFLSAQTNLTLLTSIIWGTCNTTPSADECSARMDGYQSDIQSQCSAELNAGHALTWDALNGFKNYDMYRQAACLTNMRTNAYCFADAVASHPPSDIYFYQLPLGTPLPGSSLSSANTATATGAGTGLTITPTCSACTQSLMGIYSQYATNSSLLISKTYGAAQRLVDSTSHCGNGYATAVSSDARPARLGWTIGTFAPLLVLLWMMM